MSVTESNLEVARRYLQALTAGATGQALAAFFTPDVIQHELPNRLVVNGARRDLAAILEAAERGQQVMRSQSYELLHAIEHGDAIALEVRWMGTLNLAVGSLPAGGEMRAHFAVFLDFRDGSIAAQRNYDCFEL